MMKYLESYKTNIPIIILVFYSLGYIYLNRYYSRFDISIENYISLTDIIFVTIINLVRLAIIFIFVEFVLVVISTFILKVLYSKKLNPKSDVRLRNKSIYDKYYNLVINKQINGTSFFILLIGLFVSLFIDVDFDIVILFLPFFIIKLHQITNYKNIAERNRMLQYSGLIMYFVLIVCFAIWGHNDGNFAKTSDNLSIIEFSENKTKYNTAADSLSFIGETSLYLFVYEKNSRKTLVLNKQKIFDFKVKDKTLTSEEKEKMAKDAEVQINNFLNKTEKKH